MIAWGTETPVSPRHGELEENAWWLPGHLPKVEARGGGGAGARVIPRGHWALMSFLCSPQAEALSTLDPLPWAPQGASQRLRRTCRGNSAPRRVASTSGLTPASLSFRP